MELAITILFLLLAIGIWIAIQTTNENRRRTLNQTLAKLAKKLASEHVLALAGEFQKKKKTDAYGNVDLDAWYKEVVYFADNVIWPSFEDTIPHDYRHYLNAEFRQKNYVKLAQIVDDVVAKYLDSSESENEYSEDMTGQQYEVFCALELEFAGWNAEVTKGSGDQGCDVLARRDGETIAIQCKKYKSTIGTKAVQEVIAAKAFYDADRCAVVSNSDFSRGAQELASKADVELLHHSLLETL